MVVQFFINKNYNNQFVFGYKGEQMIDYNTRAEDPTDAPSYGVSGDL